MKLIVLIIAMTGISCAKSGDKSGDTQQTADGPIVQDITNRSSCSYPATGPYGIDLYRTWRSDYKNQSGATSTQTLSFYGLNEMILYKSCSNNGHGQGSEIRIPIAISNNEIYFYPPRRQIQNIDLDCGLSWQHKSATYRFVGQCLELTFENNEKQLFPEQYSN